MNTPTDTPTDTDTDTDTDTVELAGLVISGFGVCTPPPSDLEENEQ